MCFRFYNMPATCFLWYLCPHNVIIGSSMPLIHADIWREVSCPPLPSCILSWLLPRRYQPIKYNLASYAVFTSNALVQCHLWLDAALKVFFTDINKDVLKNDKTILLFRIAKLTSCGLSYKKMKCNSRRSQLRRRTQYYRTCYKPGAIATSSVGSIIAKYSIALFSSWSPPAASMSNRTGKAWPTA